MLNQIEKLLPVLQKNYKDAFSKAVKIYQGGACQVLSHGNTQYELLISRDDAEDVELAIKLSDEKIRYHPQNQKQAEDWDEYAIAAILQIAEELHNTDAKPPLEGKAYTREGMMKRVLAERREKADKAKYKIKWADNIHGEHILSNERGYKYAVTLRDFIAETGYINNPDLQYNKLGTTKHIMYAFAQLKANPALRKRMARKYPFVEIYTDPMNDYRIAWYYPHEMDKHIAALLQKYFGDKNYLSEEEVKNFYAFFKEAAAFPMIRIRPEIEKKIQEAWEQQILKDAAKDQKLNFSKLKANLFTYQEEGVRFATFKDAAIIADEMGLGKTIQAIGTAIMKKEVFGFTRTLVICPASLKKQWQNEIEKFSHEKAVIADGFPYERASIYKNTDAYFVIVNYETVLRDWNEINKMDTDFIILDEAQKIKNFSTVTAQNIKLLKKKHALVITGTPIENKLVDLYSVMQFVNPRFLSPLWEFSYQHCYFDEEKKDKITGYYNLQELNERLKTVLLRREKRNVLKDLPKVTEITVPVQLSSEQASYHSDYARGASAILKKKFITPYDLQKLMLLLNAMRMVCDSTYLIDKETDFSPKLDELQHILTEKLDLKNNNRKVIIFSEWVTMLNLIAKMLHKEGIGFAMLSGKVAVKHRNILVKKFETDENCQVFLSSEAGGAGLNLQVADTVINFELPWNPAKKNQRIGRIDRLGQRSTHLTVINLICPLSIEGKIAAGLTVKQNLFDSVLNAGNGNDIVDFSASGRSQFLRDLEAAMSSFTAATTQDTEEPVVEQVQTQTEMEATIGELIEEETSDISPVPEEVQTSVASVENNAAQMEKVMNYGLEFLSGLFKMATGKDSGLQGSKVEVDKATGEVVMRFKMPSL